MTQAPVVTAPPLPVAPGDPGARGVYVHVPFCVVRCPYCDFNAYAGIDDLQPGYVEALVREVAAVADGGRVATVFFGGGTPTRLPPGALARVLAALRDGFALDAGAEVTVEANPESASEPVFGALLEAGFTRVSVGVQSLAPHVLRALGRVHDAGAALGALRAARAAGVPQINADLIFGTPGERPSDWTASLEGVLEAGVDHVSAYALTVEEGTPLAAWVGRGEVPAPDEDDQAAKEEIAAATLAAAGLVRYEVSNWARPGCWSRHNVNYWQAGDYVGIGAGAHGHRAGRRSWNVRNPRTYIERSPGAEEGHEVLGPAERASEAAVLGLRLAGGIDRARFASLFGTDPARRWRVELGTLRTQGLVEITPGALRVPPGALFRSGAVARSLLDV